MNPPHDTRGTEIQPGVYVAYNLSGTVARGQVVKVYKSSRYGRWDWAFKVRLLHKAAGHHVGHVSTVNNSYSMLVLLRGDSQ
jgi:hypothetical protein